ncbi:MAG: GAF domain-containing protein [Spirochaetaceae bacterium]
MGNTSHFGDHDADCVDTALVDSVLDSHTRLRGTAEGRHDIDTSLEQVGRASDVDRVYIFDVTELSDGTHTANQRYEWVREGVEPQIDNPDLQNVPLEEAGYTRWVRHLTDYRPIFGLVEEFPEEEQPLLYAQSILSLLVIPIFAGGQFCGFVGFDDCRRRKVWRRSDVHLLLSLAISFGTQLAPRGTTHADPNAHASRYVAALTSILRLRGVTGSEQPLAEVVEQTRARIRALVAVHRYVTRNHAAFLDAAELGDLLGKELRTSLDDCGRKGVQLHPMAESFPFPRELILETALLVHELVLAYAAPAPATGEDARISVGVHEERDTAVIRLHLHGFGGAVDTDSAKSSELPAPDPMGIFLARRIVQALAGLIEVPSSDAAARVVVPLRASTETN